MERLVNLLKRYESGLGGDFHSEAYYDNIGKVWTIGHGRTYNPDGSRVKKGDTTTPEAEQEFLLKDLGMRRQKILDFAEKNNYTLNDNQVDALISFDYNTSSPHKDKNSYKKLNQLFNIGGTGTRRTVKEAGEALILYHTSKGKPIDGLVNRRGYEQDLYFGGDGTKFYSNNMLQYFTGENKQQHINYAKAITRNPEFYTGQMGARTEDVVDLTNQGPLSDLASMAVRPIVDPYDEEAIFKTQPSSEAFISGNNPYYGRESVLNSQQDFINSQPPPVEDYYSAAAQHPAITQALFQDHSKNFVDPSININQGLSVPPAENLAVSPFAELPPVNILPTPLQTSAMPLKRPDSFNLTPSPPPPPGQGQGSLTDAANTSANNKYFTNVYNEEAENNRINKEAASLFLQNKGEMQGYSTGEDYVVPYTPPLYEMHGSDWGPRHQAMLENAIGGIRRRLGDKVPIEKILEAIPSSIITEIRAQVKFDQNREGKANTPVDPYNEITTSVPSMPQQYINDASQLNKPPLRIHADVLENQRERREWERLFGKDGLYPLGTTPKVVAPSNIKTYPDQQMSSLDRRFHPSDDLAMGKFTENTDTVPAMLTEGEAVIPAEAAQLKRNRAEIQRMVNEGREIQERKDELNISAFDNSYNEALAKLNEEENKNYFLNIPDRDSLTPPGKPYEPKSKYDVGFTKRLGEWWEGVGEGAKKLFYPYGPGGLSNPTVEEEKVQPKQPSTPPNYFEMENLLDKQVPPPMQGPVKPEAIPQQYINDASDYTPEQKENQNKIIESLPSDVELEQKMINLDREELQRMVTDAKKYTDANAFQFKDVTDWIEKNLGFNKQDVYRAILYYVGGRLSGGSHGGSLRWAAKQVVQESGARNTAIAKAQATAKGDIMKAMTDEAKRKLKDGYFTRAGSKLINAAIRAQDFSQLNMLLADTENPSLYNQMAMISDLSKRKPYYMRGTNPLNNMIMAPHKYKNTYVWQDPDSGEILEIPMDQVEEYKKDIDYDNMFNKFANDFKGYHNADKADPKNNNTNYKKLKRHYNVEGESDYRSKIKNISERYNISPDRVFSLVTSLLDITEDNIDPKDLNVDLESAIGSLIIDPTSMPDNDKLKNFNQKDINQIVEDFGGNPGTVTKHMQTIDEVLAGNPNANPPIPQKLVKDIKHEEVDAEIDKTNLSEEIKIKLKAIPNPYWKMVYVEFYTSRG